jgi:hypothetical protein
MTTLHMETDALLEAIERIKERYINMLDASDEIQNAGSGIGSAFEGGGGYDLQGAVNGWHNRYQNRSLDMHALIEAGWREIEEWIQTDKEFHKYNLADWIHDNVEPPSFFLSGLAGSEKTSGKPWEDSLTCKVGVEGEIYKDPSGHISVGSYEGGAKFGLDDKGQFVGGVFAEASLLTVAGTQVWGSDQFGATLGGKVDVGAVEAFAGYKDGQFGVEVGAYIAKVEGEAGLNIAGTNIGVKAGVALGWQFGIKIGPTTEFKLGPFSFGLSFGKAKTDNL